MSFEYVTSQVAKYAKSIDHEGSGLQLRFLHELDLAAQKLTTWKDANVKSFLERCVIPFPGVESGPEMPSWTCIASDTGRRIDFLHYAAEKDLATYVKVQLEKMDTTERRTVATSLLEVAIKDIREYSDTLEQWQIIEEQHVAAYKAETTGQDVARKRPKPNLKLIHMLLDYGADPNANGVLQFALKRFQNQPDMIREFVLHEADPVVVSAAGCALDADTMTVVQEALKKKGRLDRMSASLSRFRRSWQKLA